MSDKPKQPAALDEAMMERIAALLYEEAIDEPWTVAGTEHPGPDRDYYLGACAQDSRSRLRTSERAFGRPAHAAG